MARKFKELSEREILSLAISLEEEDGRIYSHSAAFQVVVGGVLAFFSGVLIGIS
jgi:uncharacterized protein involved in propanediol utilization